MNVYNWSIVRGEKKLFWQCLKFMSIHTMGVLTMLPIN